MPRSLSLISFVIAISLAFSSIAMAGWGDTLKQAGSAAADAGATAAGLPYTPSEALAGIKEVLSLGTEYATSSLSAPGGFSSNPLTAFSLPTNLSGLADSTGLLSSLNTAAEDSVPGTGNIFMNAISNLTLSDPTALINGGDDAITRFFESSSRATLKSLITPVVESSVESAGVAPYLSALSSGVTGTSFDPIDFVADRTLDGMFLLMGQKEKELRASGGASASDLIQKLF